MLRGVDHEMFRFKYVLVECRALPEMKAYLESKGYKFVESFSSQDYLFSSVQ